MENKIVSSVDGAVASFTSKAAYGLARQEQNQTIQIKPIEKKAALRIEPDHKQNAGATLPGKPLFSATNMQALLENNENKGLKLDIKKASSDKQSASIIDTGKLLKGKSVKIDLSEISADEINLKKDIKPEIDVPSVKISNDHKSKSMDLKI